MPESKKMLVFLSHASEDKFAVRKLCKRLEADGFDPWLDEQRLLPGQDWNLEIEKAMQASDAILLCFSSISVAKEGYIQREYKRAMDIQQEKPEGTIFVIPVRLDDCEMPFFIRELQCVDYPAGYDRLVMALKQRAGRFLRPPVKMKKVEEKKMTAKKKRTSRPTFEIQGGIHAQQIIMGDQHIQAGRDVIMGDQINTTTVNQPPQTMDEFKAILNFLQAQLEAIKRVDLPSQQRQMVETAEKKLAEAAEEAARPKPLGERIKTSLTEAKGYLDAIGGSLASAAALGTTIGGLLLAVSKLFGM